MRDVKSDSGVASVRLDIDVKLEDVCRLDFGFVEVQFSDVAAAAVLWTLNSVASDDNSLFIVDLMWLAPTTNDVQSCSQAMIMILA